MWSMRSLMSALARLLCPHHVVVSDGRGLVCAACGARLRAGRARRLVVQRAPRN
jgi:hypothetical protein